MKTVVEISTRSQMKTFIDFPHKLYADDKNYVPELFIAQRDLLTPGKHPFHKHSSVQLFLAYDNGKVVGRIAAILNNNHNAFNNARDGFFGFFDCVDDAEICRMLLDRVEAWLKDKGVVNIIGPANFSTNETCGLLIEGFHYPPIAMTTYNKPYQQLLLTGQGFKKKVDLLAYRFSEIGYDDRPLQLRASLNKRLQQRGITIRPVNIKNFSKEVTAVNEVYNSAWNKNLGFVPMTREEFEYLARDLKLILDTDFCLVAEKDRKMVGFVLAIPDINQLLIKVRRGRLLPVGIFKILIGRKKINGLRIVALGVLEEYRKLGVEACFYADIISAYRRKKFQYAEASWVLEDNYLMNAAILNIRGEPYKRYRVFEKAIGDALP